MNKEKVKKQDFFMDLLGDEKEGYFYYRSVSHMKSQTFMRFEDAQIAKEKNLFIWTNIGKYGILKFMKKKKDRF